MAAPAFRGLSILEFSSRLEEEAYHRAHGGAEPQPNTSSGVEVRCRYHSLPATPALECGREAAAFLSGDLSNYKIRRPNGGALPVYDDAITPRNCDFGKRRQLRDRTPRRCAQAPGMTRLEWAGEATPHRVLNVC